MLIVKALVLASAFAAVGCYYVSKAIHYAKVAIDISIDGHKH